MDREDRTLLDSYRSQLHRLSDWAESELKYGRSALFGLSAFVTVTCLLLFGLNVISLLPIVESLPVYAHTLPYVVGAFAGYTGWKYASL